MKHLRTYQIFEKFINRKKEAQIFNYNSIIKDEWTKIIRKAQKFQNINFDLENNDSLGEKKTLFIEKNLRKEQPVKNEFNCELCAAGGDWENPVMYFKVEFTSCHCISDAKHRKSPEYVFDLEDKFGTKEYTKLSRCHVFIPPVEAGNPLFKTEKGYTAYTDETLNASGLKRNDVKLNAERQKKAWKWLEDLLTTALEKRWEMLDTPKNQELKP